MKFLSSLLFALLVSVSQLFASGAASDWLTDLPKAQARAQAEGKFVLVNFSGSDWCGWCIKLRKDVFLKPEFGSYAKSNLVLVEIDFPKRKAQPPALQDANRKLAEQFQVQGYPTLLVLDARGEKLGRVNYGNGGPKSFLAEVDKVIHPPPEPPRPKALIKDVPAKKTTELRRAKPVAVAADLRRAEPARRKSGPSDGRTDSAR